MKVILNNVKFMELAIVHEYEIPFLITVDPKTKIEGELNSISTISMCKNGIPIAKGKRAKVTIEMEH